MSISFEEARSRAADVGFPIVDEEGRVSDEWWFFRVRQIGCYGIVVDKRTGELVQLGSAHTLEDWLWAYEQGIRGDLVDFTITEVFDIDATVEFLWKIRICYRQDARQALRDLPFCWVRVPLWMSIPDLRRVDRSLFTWSASNSVSLGEKCEPMATSSSPRR